MTSYTDCAEHVMDGQGFCPEHGPECPLGHNICQVDDEGTHHPAWRQSGPLSEWFKGVPPHDHIAKRTPAWTYAVAGAAGAAVVELVRVLVH